MKRGADAHWLMEGPPDREKKHSKSLIRTGCFDHSAAYGVFYAVRDYEDAFYGRDEAAFSMLGHWKYSQHVEAFGDDAIIVPLPDFGNGVFTCSGSTVDVMTTAAVDRGVADQAWTVLQAMMSPEYIQMVCNVNGGVPARKSVMDGMEQWQEGGRLYLYREQLEAGISYLRPITPAHSTLQAQMA